LRLSFIFITAAAACACACPQARACMATLRAAARARRALAFPLGARPRPFPGVPARAAADQQGRSWATASLPWHNRKPSRASRAPRAVRGLRMSSSSAPPPPPPPPPPSDGATGPFVVSNVYVSDHSKEVMAALQKRVREAAAEAAEEEKKQQKKEQKNRGCFVAWTFHDVEYNRSSMCISGSPEEVVGAVLAAVKEALAHVDYSKHAGTHPAIGAVDHVNVHPLLPWKDMQVAVATAEAISKRIARELDVPVYRYGASHPEKRSLASGRRGLGYFKSHKTGVLKQGPGRPLPLTPCYGPKALDPKKGVCMVGACRWVVNYNVPVGADSVAAARPACDRIREAKGGLKGVQAMALQNENGIEIACNLLAIDEAGPEEVGSALKAACEETGIEMRTPYIIGQLPKAVLERTTKMLGGGDEET